MAEKGWPPRPPSLTLFATWALPCPVRSLTGTVFFRGFVLAFSCPTSVLMVLTLILTQFLVPTSLSTLALRLQVDANPVYPHSLKLNMCSQIQLLFPILSFSPLTLDFCLSPNHSPCYLSSEFAGCYLHLSLALMFNPYSSLSRFICDFWHLWLPSPTAASLSETLPTPQFCYRTNSIPASVPGLQWLSWMVLFWYSFYSVLIIEGHV